MQPCQVSAGSARIVPGAELGSTVPCHVPPAAAWGAPWAHSPARFQTPTYCKPPNHGEPPRTTERGAGRRRGGWWGGAHCATLGHVPCPACKLRCPAPEHPAEALPFIPHSGDGDCAPQPAGSKLHSEVCWGSWGGVSIQPSRSGNRPRGLPKPGLGFSLPPVGLGSPGRLPGHSPPAPPQLAEKQHAGSGRAGRTNHTQGGFFSAEM